MATVSSGRAWLLLSGFLWGCGTLGDASELPDAWPRTPLRGFALHDAETPLLISQSGSVLDQPAVQPQPEGSSRLVVWGRRSERGQSARSSLFRSEVTDLATPTTPQSEVMPTGWEGTALRAPTWLPAESTDGLGPLLLYQGEDGSVGVASVDDTGSLQRLTPTAPLLSRRVLLGPEPGPTGMGDKPNELGRISIVALGEQLRLYYTVDATYLRFAQLSKAGLQARLRNQTAEVPVVLSQPVLWASDFEILSGRSDRKPAQRLDGVMVRAVLTPTGRQRLDLYAAAAIPTKSVLVSASLYPGSSPAGQGERFLPVEAPLLAANTEGEPSSPTLTIYQGQPLLLLGLRQVSTGIAAAVMK